MDRPAPKLHMMDKWQLMARRGTRDRRSSAQLLHQVVALEQQVTKLPVPNMLAVSATARCVLCGRVAEHLAG